MTKGRAAALAGAALALAAGGWALFGGREEAAPPPKAPESGAQQMEGLRLEGTGANGGRWVLSAEKAQSDAGGEVGKLSDVKFVYTARDSVTTGTAARAEKKTSGGSYGFSGGVVLARGEWTARTESVDYDPVKGLASGEGEVSVSSGEMTLTGKGFFVDMNGSVAKILSNSHAVVTPRKGAIR